MSTARYVKHNGGLTLYIQRDETDEKFSGLERFMSTGENINANGAVLSQAMIRAGFNRFPQSFVARVNARLYPQLVPYTILQPQIFQVLNDPAVPAHEVWFTGADGAVLGRIVNLSVGTPTSVTQDDSLDFDDNENDQAKVKRQRDRRIKDALL
jgi:hypothetical protein